MRYLKTRWQPKWQSQQVLISANVLLYIAICVSTSLYFPYKSIMSYFLLIRVCSWLPKNGTYCYAIRQPRLLDTRRVNNTRWALITSLCSTSVINVSACEGKHCYCLENKYSRAIRPSKQISCAHIQEQQIRRDLIMVKLSSWLEIQSTFILEAF